MDKWGLPEGGSRGAHIFAPREPTLCPWTGVEGGKDRSLLSPKHVLRTVTPSIQDAPSPLRRSKWPGAPPPHRTPPRAPLRRCLPWSSSPFGSGPDPGDPCSRVQGPPPRGGGCGRLGRGRGRDPGAGGPGRGALGGCPGSGAARGRPGPCGPRRGERRPVGALGNRKRFIRREWWGRGQAGRRWNKKHSRSGPFPSPGGRRASSAERAPPGPGPSLVGAAPRPPPAVRGPRCHRGRRPAPASAPPPGRPAGEKRSAGGAGEGGGLSHPSGPSLGQSPSVRSPLVQPSPRGHSCPSPSRGGPPPT